MKARPDTLSRESGAPPRVLIGGVGYHWQGDLSFGAVAAEELGKLEWPPGVSVADLGYGAIFVAQDLADASPPWERLVLIGAAVRNRAPGLYRVLPDLAARAPDELQARIREAGAGVIDLDHLIAIAGHFAALPEEVVVIELEPTGLIYGAHLSPLAAEALPAAIRLVREAATARWSETIADPRGGSPGWSSLES